MEGPHIIGAPIGLTDQEHTGNGSTTVRPARRARNGASESLVTTVSPPETETLNLTRPLSSGFDTSTVRTPGASPSAPRLRRGARFREGGD